MAQYDCWFCHCGRIQVMDYAMYDWLREDHEKRRVIRVCQHCGETRIVWMEPYWDGYALCSSDFYDKTITPDDDKEYAFILSKGITVPLMDGHNADCLCARMYCNADYIKEKYNTTDLTWVKENHPESVTVDVERFIAENKSKRDILESISGYVAGIDFSGTEFASKY